MLTFANAWGATGLVGLAFVWLGVSMLLGFKYEGFNHKGLGPSMLTSVVVGTVGFAAIFLLAIEVQ